MRDIINCPYCPRKLQVPANVLGRQVQCPSCGQTFLAGQSAPQAPAAPDAALAELYEHVSESQPASILVPLPSLSIAEEARIGSLASLPDLPPLEPGTLEYWQQVMRGVGLLYRGVVLGMVATLSLMCVSCGVFGSRTAGPETTALAMILVGLLLLGGLASVGLQVVGQVFCLRSSLPQRPRTQAKISLLLLLGGLVIILLGWVLALCESDGCPDFRVGVLIANLDTLIVLAQLLVFLRHLRAIALNMRLLELATSIGQLTYLVAGIITALLAMWGAVFTFITTVGSINGKIGGLVFWFFASTLLIMSPLGVSWYIYVLSELRQAVTAYVRRRERQEPTTE